MGKDFIFTICCPSCATIVGKSYNGSKTFTHCPKCQAELYYEVKENSSTIMITKAPKHLPIAPALPAPN